MNKHLKRIESQIKSNEGKNLFFDDNQMALRFVDETLKAIPHLADLSPDEEEFLINYAGDKAMEEFCRINQYCSFNPENREELRELYRELLKAIRDKKISTQEIEESHYKNLKLWLKKTNPFTEKLYSGKEEKLEPVPCSEYGADLQLNLLNLDPRMLLQPFLDIGCGRQGNLVNHFRNLGISATGIDRFSFSEGGLINAHWLEYDYGTEKWGTIASNLAFSNHFKHHHLRHDGQFLEYAKCYMSILRSLKKGGSFHYAPALPFIEQYLNKEEFEVKSAETIGFGYTATIVKRLYNLP